MAGAAKGYLAEVFAPDTIVGERYAAVHALAIAR
jgi:hypothetical protein